MREQYMPNFDNYVPLREGGYSQKRLAGGITNESYKITPNKPVSRGESVVLTIFRDPSSWGALERENAISKLVKGDSDVVIPRILDSGIDVIEGNKFAFLLREYIEGDDLDTVLNLGYKNGDQEVTDVIVDLGFRIGALHRHKTAVYGLLGNPEGKYSSWGEYVFDEIESEMQSVRSMQSNKQIGAVRVVNIVETFHGLDVVLGTSQHAFQDSEPPMLAHGDARFANFIADKKAGRWVISGMIDMEEAVGGDPGIDFAFIENWLHFADYKDEFYQNSSKFTDAYINACAISMTYDQRRLTYHVLRSLSYLRTVFGFNSVDFLRNNPKNEDYIKKHFKILESISKGNGLEDLGIKSLTPTH